MMKRFISIFFLLLLILPARAQLTVSEVFRQMPDEQIAFLTKNDRMDLVDFMENKMAARVTNRLDGTTTLDSLTADYLHLTLTAISTLEMKLIPVKDSVQVVAVVHTVAGPSKDSKIRIYTSDWKKELDASAWVSYPSLDDYLVKPETEMNEEECQLIHTMTPILIEVSLEPESTAFTFRRSIGVLPKMQQSQAEGLLKPVRVMPCIPSSID